MDMKKVLMGIIMLASSLGVLHAQANGFRGFAWGESIANVQAGEKAKLEFKEGNDELNYHDLLAGSDCNVSYIFNDNDKLESGVYLFTKKYSNPQLYLQDYNKFKTLLTQKYGKPASEKEAWQNNTPLAEKHNYGQAIADGNLSMNTLWDAGNTTVKIILVSFDKHPSLQIHYTSKSLDELENKQVLKEALNKL
jgi:hypothetical protein